MEIKASVLFLATALGLPLVGCGSYLKERELQRVARDWCMTIRASQVIPVYPLTADLQPGDVFLVTAPIERQSATYRKRGFLPLDQAYVRLKDLDFAGYYKSEYWDNRFAKVPHTRSGLAAVSGAGTTDGGTAVPANVPATSFTVEAPPAAFPTYTFQIRSGGGIKAAFPVQGIPVGLSVMQTDSADGSLSISDASTYGAPPDQLLGEVKKWTEIPRNRADLAAIARGTSAPVYLRIVQRVYMASAVNVSLVNSNAVSTAVDVADPKKIELQGLESVEAAEKYKTLLDKLSGAANEGLPGGSLRFAAATKLGVVLNEKFKTPLVIGYLGYDLPVYETGDLGAPVLTIERLEEGGGPPLPIGVLSEDQAQVQFRRDSLFRKIHTGKITPTDAAAVLANIARGIPDQELNGLSEKADKAAKSESLSKEQALDLLNEIWQKIKHYASADGRRGPRYARVIHLYESTLKEGASDE